MFSPETYAILKSIINKVKNRMTTAEDDIDSLETRMGTAEDDIDSLETRMGTAEGDISNLKGTDGQFFAYSTVTSEDDLNALDIGKIYRWVTGDIPAHAPDTNSGGAFYIRIGNGFAQIAVTTTGSVTKLYVRVKLFTSWYSWVEFQSVS